MKINYLHMKTNNTISFLIFLWMGMNISDGMASPYDPVDWESFVTVDLGTKTNSFSFSDTKNTADYSDKYCCPEIDFDSKDVVFKFKIDKPMDIIVSHCGSVLHDTYVCLVNESGACVAHNDDKDSAYPDAGCSNDYQAYIKVMNLPKGTYYVLSEGNGTSGYITTNIQGIVPGVRHDIGTDRKSVV